MAKITRYNGNLKAFGEDAQGTERTVFGDTTQSDALDDNLNTGYFRGWGEVGVNENPTKQDFNAVSYTNGALLKYLFQRGVPEWDALQEYYAPAAVLHNGNLWIAATDPTVGDEPGVDAVWTGSQVVASETQAGVAEIATQAETNAGTDDEKIVTPEKLRFGFAISLASSGYIAFPSWMGGLMVQWGSYSEGGTPLPEGGNLTRSVTFPVAFPTAVLIGFASTRYNYEIPVFVDGATTTGGVISFSSAASGAINIGANYLVIGY